MRVAISERYLSLNKRLAEESNRLSEKFSSKNYSKIEDIDEAILKRDISVERKKAILVKKLHDLILGSFSVGKKNLSKKTFGLLKKRLHSMRKITLKLRSINYYLETSFLEDLRASKIKISGQSQELKQEKSLAGSEIETLEYAAYMLISDAVALDKRALSEYASKEKKAAAEEKIEAKAIGAVLAKQSGIMEHLEAKLPPPRSASSALMREPVFTHWASRVLALLSCLEHLHSAESAIFAKLKKKSAARKLINMKISHLIREKSRLLAVMEEKAASMKKQAITGDFKRKARQLNAAAGL